MSLCLWKCPHCGLSNFEKDDKFIACFKNRTDCNASLSIYESKTNKVLINKKFQVFFIGFNGYGEFGFGHANPIRELTECPYPITKVHAGKRYIIYSDDNYENIWSTGFNRYGSCAVTNDESDHIISRFRSIISKEIFLK